MLVINVPITVPVEYNDIGGTRFLCEGGGCRSLVGVKGIILFAGEGPIIGNFTTSMRNND